ncbi:MAG: tRNA pseudouridine(55) synthase TruB, partial [Bacilli bacterium]|nr:tRNA pseudouridine(55) synthase TruB [Bacilli bacterium]
MNGILLIDKPSGMTSHDAVNRLRRLLKTKKIGHVGTLDPLATGLLVMVVGQATKLAQYLQEANKEYLATILLGMETDTDDITGKIVNRSEVEVDQETIKQTMESFIGKTLQIPPNYAAIKINGKKMYEYARQDKALPKIEPRPIDIETIDQIEFNEDTDGRQLVAFRTVVSKGTYIRALARDIGRKLGSYATLTSLQRTRVDKFSLENAYTLEEVEANKHYFIDP